MCQKLLHTKLQFTCILVRQVKLFLDMTKKYSPSNAVVKVNVAKENKYECIFKKYMVFPSFSFIKKQQVAPLTFSKYNPLTSVLI